MSDRGHHHLDDSNTITLPRLHKLLLNFLPTLKSIYTGTMVCNLCRLQYIKLNCPMLRRLPICPPVDNKQATAPPSLKLIWGDEEWWESLERNDPGTKIILQPLLEWRFGDVGRGRFLILEELGFAMLFDSPPINFRLIVA